MPEKSEHLPSKESRCDVFQKKKKKKRENGARLPVHNCSYRHSERTCDVVVFLYCQT